MATEIVVALIAGGFALLGTLIEVSRRQNNRDHGTNASKLDLLFDSHRRVESKVDDLADRHLEHIRDHAKGDL
jgi:hypothetical protein